MGVCHLRCGVAVRDDLSQLAPLQARAVDTPSHPLSPPEHPARSPPADLSTATGAASADTSLAESEPPWLPPAWLSKLGRDWAAAVPPGWHWEGCRVWGVVPGCWSDG